MAVAIRFWLRLLLCLNEARILISVSDFYFESVEFSGAEKIPFNGNASIKRSGKGHPKIFADFEITEDLTNYDTEVKVYYSRLGNNQFILMLFEFSRMPVCELQNKDIFVNMRHSLHNCSNLPIPDDPNVKSCDMPPLGHYYLRNCVLEDPSIFPDRMPAGRFRFVWNFYKRTGNEVLQAIISHIHFMRT